MQDILYDLESWMQSDKDFAIATVIKTWGSSPRLPGSALAVSSEQEMLGSVSGGCVEGAVMQASLEILNSNVPQRLDYGVADEDAWRVGLSCGGKLSVFAERFVGRSAKPADREVWTELLKASHQNKGCVMLTQMSGGENAHLLVFPDGHEIGLLAGKGLTSLALNAYQARKNQVILHEEVEYFAQVFPRKSQLLIIGSAHITVDLVELAHDFGFETIVVDPRGIFSQKTTFSTPPDHMHQQWPQEVLEGLSLDAYTYAVLLTHDPKIDDPALHILLRSGVAYIGALGSSRTHRKRVARLQEAGFSEAEIARIHGPIGVDINAKRPREIALSILAQMIQIKNQHL
ncbi:MAG: XdhC family protein [Bacteroidota bacterium]